MFNLTLKTEWGQINLDNSIGNDFTISEIEGLASPEAIINMSEQALLDGQKFNSSKMQTRTLNIAFAIEHNAAQNRLVVYDVLHTKKAVRVIYESDVINVYIDGYIQALDITHFEMKNIVTVTVICPAPYFKSLNAMLYELSQNIRAFHFPFAITEEDPIPLGYWMETPRVTVDNVGQAETGLIFNIEFHGTVTILNISDYDTGEWFRLNDTFQNGDRVVINTNRGEKTVQLFESGVQSNIFNSVVTGSTWFQITTSRTFTFNVYHGDIDDVDISISHSALYEGV